ncbi:class II aldolase/adducin family protein [Actinomadura sp. 21ATH]|uniref:class II aldolase/adducin family protein n=1 Tax=Actinomadura sp. 21ATH TaxID=1735444 RepID=UPI0035C208C6
MTATDTRTTTPAPVAGGAAEWSPAVMPPIGADLTGRQKLACAFGILARSGFTENIAGHITVRAEDSADPESLWINPWGLWWEEITASDVCRVSPGGDVLEGRWDVTPAYHIHTELHRRRPDARVVVHNHPYHATVLAALGALPEFVHQTGSMFDGDLAFVDEYTGEVASPELGADLAERIGDASVVLLANHGVIVTGASVEEAVYRAATLERQCRLTCDVLGRDRTLVPPPLRRAMKASLLERGTDFFWNGAVRALLRDRPEVLD